ncbi:hypothetical protein MYAM1_002661 [Malassezia yamatoensis]|uniref:C3H1-type domain-containing protein n=1 Tax=Malassezia yamatoensis TaxID=253288 RepID=A0AAJ5YTI1_9BASI|nr:hypothetical protein MYAM1_002661 [Malassezia yamatoensis]
MPEQFSQACSQGNLASVRQQLEQNPSLANAQDADPRAAQSQVTPTNSNTEAIAILREAALHEDTRLANGNASQTSENQSHEPSGNMSLPPPEIARMIPCRFFPNCRYGDQCLFFHPTGPMMPPPQGAQPMFYPGPNGMPFSPGPGPYGVPPEFMEMNPAMMPMHYGPNGVPFYPQQPMPPSENQAEASHEDVPTSSQPPHAGSQVTNSELEALSNSMDTLGSSTADLDTASSQMLRASRNASKIKSSSKSRNDSSNSTQRSRSNNSSRPTCAFFVRSACRYGNDCRFPHLLPDGSDARSPTVESGKAKSQAQRRANTPTTDQSATDTPDSPTNGAISNKKAGARNARNGSAPSSRGKGSRRNAAPAPNRKSVQRVPNSDEFPALPGGGSPLLSRAEGQDSSPTESGTESKPKVNFSAILSAPAPPKSSKLAKSDGDADTSSSSSPAPTLQETESASNLTAELKQDEQPSTNSPSPSSRDFAAVAAASQPNAVSV